MKTLKDVMEMMDEQIINGLRCNIAFIKPWIPENSRDQFPASKQSLLLSGDGIQIWANLKGHDEIPITWKGQTVELNSHLNERTKVWFGWKKQSYVNTATNAETVVINGSKSASIKLVTANTNKSVPQQKKVNPEPVEESLNEPEKEVQHIETNLQMPNTEIIKNRGIALSYAKDLVVSNKIDISQLLDVSDTISSYVISNNNCEKIEWKKMFGKKTELENDAIEPVNVTEEDIKFGGDK